MFFRLFSCCLANCLIPVFQNRNLFAHKFRNRKLANAVFISKRQLSVFRYKPNGFYLFRHADLKRRVMYWNQVLNYLHILAAPYR